MPETDERTSALVLEIELPEFYAEDLRADNPDWQRWLRDVDADPADAAAVGQEILHNIGEVYSGLLTIRITGEKDAETIRTPVLMVGARVEDRPPSSDGWKDATDRLAERVDEPHDEERVLGKIASAELRVLERFAIQIKNAYTGQISQLAEQALQEARLAADEAEKRHDPDGTVLG